MTRPSRKPRRPREGGEVPVRADVVKRWQVTDPDILDALDELDRFFLLIGVARDHGFIRCGDVVRHHPTGEKWVVSYADYARNRLSWAGWPEGMVPATECSRVIAASDEAHEAKVKDWLDPTRAGGDHRVGEVRRLYGKCR